MRVIFGRKFAEYFPNFPKADKEKIVAFANHIENFGFNGLQERNKPSDHVPTHNPNWSERVSEYVLHYIKENDCIILVDMSPYPPLQLPKPEYLI